MIFTFTSDLQYINSDQYHNMYSLFKAVFFKSRLNIEHHSLLSLALIMRERLLDYFLNIPYDIHNYAYYQDALE